MILQEVYESIKKGQREFFDRISGRKVSLCGYDLDDGCTGYAQVFDIEGKDFEYLGLVDLSCLNALGKSNDGSQMAPEEIEVQERLEEEQVAEFETHLYCMYDPVEICGETFYPQDILRMLSPEKYRSEYLTFIGQESPELPKE